MKKVISQERFEELKASGQLPSPKGVALAVIELIRREDVTMPEVARVVQSDPALAGRVLKLANSAHAGMRRPIASISEAVSVLGFPTLRQVALGLSVLSSYRSGKCAAFNYQDFWSGSLATAIATQMLSANAKTSAEETFICGLLGDIGRLALATLFPEPYGKILEQGRGTSLDAEEQLERAAFATTHRELTSALLLDWGLPKVFVDAVYFHENPEEAELEEGSRDFVLTHALHLAANLAKVCLAKKEVRRQMLPTLFRSAARLGIDADQLAIIAERVVAEWQGWGKILDVPTQPLPPLSEIAASMPVSGGKPENPANEAPPMRIMVVDDQASTRQFMQAILAAAGHQVVAANNGKEALSLALEFNPQLIVTDWVMPEMDGIGLCKSLRATRSGQRIYIIILTALEDEDHLIEAFEAGVDDYIVKPLNERVIKARLRAGQRVIRLQEEIEREREEIRRYAAELAVTKPPPPGSRAHRSAHHPAQPPLRSRPSGTRMGGRQAQRTAAVMSDDRRRPLQADQRQSRSRRRRRGIAPMRKNPARDRTHPGHRLPPGRRGVSGDLPRYRCPCRRPMRRTHPQKIRSRHFPSRGTETSGHPEHRRRYPQPPHARFRQLAESRRPGPLRRQDPGTQPGDLREAKRSGTVLGLPRLKHDQAHPQRATHAGHVHP